MLAWGAKYGDVNSHLSNEVVDVVLAVTGSTTLNEVVELSAPTQSTTNEH